MTRALIVALLVPTVAVAGDAAPPPEKKATETTKETVKASANAVDPMESNGVPTGDHSSSGLGIDGLASVDPSTGFASSSYSFEVPQPRGSLALKVSISYNSSVSDSDAGVGWSLGIPSIERRSGSGSAHPKYNDPPTGQAISAGRNDLNSQDEFLYGGSPLAAICFIPAGTCGNNPIPDFAKGGGWHLYKLVADGAQGYRFFWSPDHKTWVVTQKSGEVREMGVPLEEGVRSLLGRTTDVDFLPPPRNSAPYRWKVSRQYDGHRGPDGQPKNVTYYVWNSDGALDDIFYTRNLGVADPWQRGFAHHVHFNYAPYEFPRAATRSDHVAWHNVPLARLSGVDVTSDTGHGSRELVRRYLLSYENNYHHSYLTSIQQQGRCDEPVAEQADFKLPVTTSCPGLPPRTMTYTDTNPSFTGYQLVGHAEWNRSTPPIMVDANSDGLPDFYKAPVYPEPEHPLYINTLQRGTAPLSKRIIKLDAAKNAAHHPYLGQTYGDFGNSYPGGRVAKMVRFGPTGWYFGGTIPEGGQHPTENTWHFAFYPNEDENGQWQWRGGPLFQVHYPEHPSIGNLGFGDYDADGYLDSLNFAYDTKDGGEWVMKGVGLNRTEKFPEKYAAEGSRVSYFGLRQEGEYNGAELDGTCADSFISRKLYESHERFRDESPDSVPPLQVADMDGDGLLDLVEFARDSIGDAVVWYWPGRGDVNFGINACTGSEASGLECRCNNGAAVKMHVGPGGPAPEDPHRDRYYLQDVSGDGLTDIIRPEGTLIRIWINFDGQYWSSPQVIDMQFFPGWDADKTHIMFADMNGSGTTDIIVIQHSAEIATIAYIDLLRDGKPGLLSRIRGEHGAETNILYETIQEAQVRAEKSGHPWRTHTPQVQSFSQSSAI